MSRTSSPFAVCWTRSTAWSVLTFTGRPLALRNASGGGGRVELFGVFPCGQPDEGLQESGGVVVGFGVDGGAQNLAQWRARAASRAP